MLLVWVLLPIWHLRMSVNDLNSQRKVHCYKSAPQYFSARTHSDLFADVKVHFVYQYTISFNWLSLADQISSLQILLRNPRFYSVIAIRCEFLQDVTFDICHILHYYVQYPNYLPLNIVYWRNMVAACLFCMTQSSECAKKCTQIHQNR